MELGQGVSFSSGPARPGPGKEIYWSGKAMDKKSVLFLCTGNSARSQMAEALLRHHGGDRFAAYSAGLDPKGVHPLTIRVMEERGIDISGQHSKDVGLFLGKLTAHHVIIVCERAERNCPVLWPGALELLSWPFEDPAALEGDEEAKLKKFRTVRDQIEERIRSWLMTRREEE
jgi:arsenate reductase